MLEAILPGRFKEIATKDGVTDTNGIFHPRVSPTLTSDTIEIASSGFVTAGGVEYRPYRVFDGVWPPQYSTAFLSSGKTPNAWIEWRPLIATRCTGFRLWSQSSGTAGGGVSKFNIQSSSDGIQYKTVLEVLTPRANAKALNASDPSTFAADNYLNKFDETAKYWRFNMLDVDPTYPTRSPAVMEIMFVQ